MFFVDDGVTLSKQTLDVHRRSDSTELAEVLLNGMSGAHSHRYSAFKHLHMLCLNCFLIISFKVDDSVTTLGQTGISPAVFISLTQVACLLPRLQSATITISNDGQNQSDGGVQFIVYNSICHNCFVANGTIEPKCERQVNMSRDMRFLTLYHFDKCRFRRAYAAYF